MHVRSRGQAAELAAECPVSFIAFDLLRLYGVDLTGRPLAQRRATLARHAADHPQWTVSPLFDDGPATEAAARQHGLEGVVAKRLEGTYRPGTRAADWVKVKFARTATLAVLGWEADADTPERLSSLLVGYRDGAGWAFAGKVGSGLTAAVADRLQRRLVPAAAPPVVPVPARSPGRVARWVEPEVVVEVRYGEWAPDGRLRHPVLLGLRDDVPAAEVTARSVDRDDGHPGA